MSVDPALLRSTLITRAALVDLDFASAPMGLWTGSGPLDLQHQGLRYYLGMGHLAQVGSIEQASGGQAPQLQLTLAGIGTDVMSRLVNAEAETAGRRCTIRMGLWREGAHGQPEFFAGSIVMGVGLMDKMTLRMRRESGDDGASVLLGDVTLAIESLFSGRRKAATESPYTDNDQQIRFPGDLGLRHAATMVNNSMRWPRFIGDTAD